jgi:hypothetical protein
MNVCADCKFCKHRPAQAMFLAVIPETFLCTHEQCRDYISGSQLPCFAARHLPASCGMDGKLWEARDVVKE